MTKLPNWNDLSYADQDKLCAEFRAFAKPRDPEWRPSDAERRWVARAWRNLQAIVEGYP